MSQNIRVLVVDDSLLLRQVISDILEEAPGMEVVGTARDGVDAIGKIARLRPDMVTLDVQMPGMDGLDTLKKLLAEHPTRVIMVSALTQRDAEVTLQALEIGALDYVAKPEGLRGDPGKFGEELLTKIRAMAGTDVRRVLRVRKQRTERMQRQRTAPVTASGPNNETASARYADCCIALGISTGGPPALANLFPSLRPPLPALVVVQHMPANFTGSFARRLDSISDLFVKEAEGGEILSPNTALIAPGGKHLRLKRRGKQVVTYLTDEPPVSSHKPSIDVMMTDAAKAYSNRCLGIIMTGMGSDGAAGCAEIRRSGGYVLGQDEASSDVYGMNKVAFQQGHVDQQFSLDELAERIQQRCKRMFPAKPVAGSQSADSSKLSSVFSGHGAHHHA